MKKSFTHLSLFFILNGTTAYTMMMTPSNTKKICTLSQPHSFLSLILLDQRLKTTKLLLEDGPFDFLKLPPELHPYVAAFTKPKDISNLSVTCHQLHEEISFQTPYIWKIVAHSLNAISKKKLPELLVKAHLCANAATDEQKKLFYIAIKERILAVYDPKLFDPYRFSNPAFLWRFDPFSSPSRLLLSACYTGDEKIVTDTLHLDNVISYAEMLDLFYVTIDRENTKILPILCARYAAHLEAKFLAHLESEKEFDWHQFGANAAINNNKNKSFEILINYYKKYLNLIDKNKNTYLDYVSIYLDYVKDYLKKNNEISDRNYQHYIEIIEQHGGIATRKSDQ